MFDPYATTSWTAISASRHHHNDDNGDKSSQWSSLVGIITAIIGNILISFALNIQRYAHIRIDREYHDGREKKKSGRKALPKSLRGYGTAVRQEEIAEERSRLNASAPGPPDQTSGGQSQKDNETSSDTLSASGGNDENNGSHEKQEGEHERKSYLRSPYWWAGIILMAVGEAGNFLAYGFAPASIVSPLGVVALISNCLIAPLMLKERFRARDFWGVIIAIGGAVTVVFSASTSETKMGPDELLNAIERWEFLTYICITIVLIIALMIASPRYGRRTVLIDLGLVGLFGGYTALSTKGVASMLSDTLWRAVTFPITYALVAVLAISAVMQIRYINRALSHFDSTQVIPIQFVLFTLSVIIGSAVLYRDFQRTTADRAIKFIIGCLLTFSGVYLITSGRKSGNEDDDEDDDDSVHDERIRLLDEEAMGQDERTPTKPEIVQTSQFDRSERRSSSTGPSTPSRGQASSSIPSIAVSPTPSSPVDDINKNPFISSTDHLLRTTTPKTPQTRVSKDLVETPFFTPSSVPDRRMHPPPLGSRSDSSPAVPQTPVRQSRAPSPPKPDLSALRAAGIKEARPTTLFRTAKGSIERLIPGPLLAPLSSSLSALVADSILKGEGSPQAKTLRRTLRRNRSTSHGTGPDIRRKSNNSGIFPDNESPILSRWTTRDDGEEIPYTPISESIREQESEMFDENSDARPMTSKRRSRLGSLSDTLGGLLRRDKDDDRGKTVERNEGRS